MRRHYLTRQGVRALLFGTLSAATLSTQAAEPTTLSFEQQALDLDSGTVVAVTPAALGEASGADVTFAYHADRMPHAVVVPAQPGVELAFLDDTGFDAVTADTVASLTFSAEPLDESVEIDDTVVVRTDSGAVYKLGNAVEDGGTVTFNYAAL